VVLFSLKVVGLSDEFQGTILCRHGFGIAVRCGGDRTNLDVVVLDVVEIGCISM